MNNLPTFKAPLATRVLPDGRVLEVWPLFPAPRARLYVYNRNNVLRSLDVESEY